MSGKSKDDETGAAGEETQDESQAQEEPTIDYAAEIASRDASLAERDGHIAELEAQVAEAGRVGEENAALKAEVEQPADVVLLRPGQDVLHRRARVGARGHDFADASAVGAVAQDVPIADSSAHKAPPIIYSTVVFAVL